MRIQFNDHRGSLIWDLPPDAQALLEAIAPEARAKILESFASNLGTLCGALLAAFGHPAKAETLNLIMREVWEVAQAEIAVK